MDLGGLVVQMDLVDQDLRVNQAVLENLVA